MDINSGLPATPDNDEVEDTPTETEGDEALEHEAFPDAPYHEDEVDAEPEPVPAPVAEEPQWPASPVWPAGYEGPFERMGRGVFDMNGRMLCTCGDAGTSISASERVADLVVDALNGHYITVDR